MLRTGRKGLAAATLLLDAAKGAAAVLLARVLAGRDAALVAGLGAVLGHLFPLWLGFRGGKGGATGLGVLLASAWPVGVLACAVWLAVAAVLRRSSLATLAHLRSRRPSWPGHSPIAAKSRSPQSAPCWSGSRHHANIRRLLAGTEPRIGARH